MVTRVCLTPAPIAFPSYVGELCFIPGGTVRYLSRHLRFHPVIYITLNQRRHAAGCRIVTPSKSFGTQCRTNWDLRSLGEICGAVGQGFCIVSEVVNLSNRDIYEMGAIIESRGFKKTLYLPEISLLFSGRVLPYPV